MGAGHSHGGGDSRVSRMVIAAGILTAFLAIELTTALAIGSRALLADTTPMRTAWGAVVRGLKAGRLKPGGRKIKWGSGPPRGCRTGLQDTGA